MSDIGNRTKKVELRQEINQMSLIDVVSESLIAYIIAGLPIASICACRCVCKLFLRLISEKCFTKLIVEKSPYTTIVFNNDFGVHMIELAKEYCKSYKSILPSNNMKAVGSCNGLLCFLVICKNRGCNMRSQPIPYIYNPVLGQYGILPEPRKIPYSSCVYWFGFSSLTGPYKILRISTLDYQTHPIYRKRSEAEIYIVGTRTWKSVGYLPFPSNQESLTTIVNGAFHWLFYNEMKDFTFLYAFKIEEEQDYQISFPPNIGNGEVNMSVGVLKECLCLFDNSYPTHFGIWSMKEYGVGESWALKCILTTSIPAGLNASTLYPIIVMKDDVILMKSQSGNFFIYDHKDMNITRFEIDSVELLAGFSNQEVYSSNFYPPDLISTGCLTSNEISCISCGHLQRGFIRR